MKNKIIGLLFMSPLILGVLAFLMFTGILDFRALIFSLGIVAYIAVSSFMFFIGVERFTYGKLP